MKWRGRRQSENVEDCQGMSPRPAIGGGAILLIAIVIGGRMRGCDQGQIQQAVEVAQWAQQQGVPQQGPAEAQGYTMPERYTHRTSRQRVRCLRERFRSGDLWKARLIFDLAYEEL